MASASLCEQCKSYGPPSNGESPSSSRSNRASPCSSNISTPKSKPIYVLNTSSDKTCITVGKPPCHSRNNSGGNNFSVQLSPSNKLNVVLPNRGGYNLSAGNSNSSCIEIMSNSIIQTSSGVLQIIPGRRKFCGGMQIPCGGGMQISLDGGRLLLGPPSKRNGCPSGSSDRNSGAIVSTDGRCQLQVDFGKGRGTGPSIKCGRSGDNLQICYGPTKRKLDMNHSKPTIAYLIHKSMNELEREVSLAQCAYSYMHPSLNW